MKLKITILFFLCIGTTSFSQKLIFENIGTRSGLPSAEVYHVHQGKKGYIWFFTEYGIVKYNGSSFLPVCQNLDKEKSAVYAVTESRSGDIYFANSKAEIYRVHKDKAYRIQGPKLSKISNWISNTGLYVNTLYFEADGTMWISTSESTHSINTKDYWVKELPKDVFSVSKHSFFIKRARDPKRDTWIGNARWVYFLAELISQDKKRYDGLLNELVEGMRLSGRFNA